MIYLYAVSFVGAKSRGSGLGRAQADLYLGLRLGLREFSSLGSRKPSLGRGMQAEPSLYITTPSIFPSGILPHHQPLSNRFHLFNLPTCPTVPCVCILVSNTRDPRTTPSFLSQTSPHSSLSYLKPTQFLHRTDRVFGLCHASNSYSYPQHLCHHAIIHKKAN